ncbi:asparagine synthase (glutamine-hydrolyzing) [Alsobacter sp. R-9]
MCAINGIFAYQRAAAEPNLRELVATRDAMAARGPDGRGEWWSQDRRVAFGHRRLAIIGLGEQGAQPMSTPDGRFTITFNGEIYNFGELRQELIAQRIEFRGQSDTEVLLYLYAERGPAMVEALRGMFAFAIWDAREHTLFLARDPYGIKPLYYANDGWTFRFASQVKALLAGGGVSSEPEPAGLVGFRLWGHVPEPFTIHRDIRAVPAGHTMLVDLNGPNLPQRYWSLAGVLAGPSGASPEGDAATSIRHAVKDSVRHHLVADVEVGVFLSAGIDSGALLGLARDLGHDRLRAITLAFAEYTGTDDDETPLARQVAALYGAEHVVRRVEEAEFRQDLPAILDAMDQPSIDGVNTWFVAKAAGEAGLKVALSGLGGDELLGGYPSFRDIPAWRRRFGWAALIPGLGALTEHLLRALAPDWVTRRPKAAGLLRYAGSWEGAYLLRRGLFLPSELDDLLPPDIVREGLRRLAPLTRLRQSLQPDPGHDVTRVTALESCHYMRDQLLRDADWAGMAHAVEIRTPLVDASLVATLAPFMPYLPVGTGKRHLAAAPVTPLPRALVDRSKTGFTVPTGRWMAESARARTGSRSRGLVSRDWSGVVLAGAAAATPTAA